jgi:hypothetical protein
MATEAHKPTILLYDKYETTLSSVKGILTEPELGLEGVTIDATTKYSEARELLRRELFAQRPYDLVITGCYKDNSRETSEGVDVAIHSSIASQVIVLSGELYFTLQRLIGQGIPANRINAILSEPVSRQSKKVLEHYNIKPGARHIPTQISMFETPPSSYVLSDFVRKSMEFQKHKSPAPQII